MFSSSTHSRWDRIVPATMVQLGKPVISFPRWSRNRGAIVLPGRRTVGRNRNRFFRRWTSDLRIDQGRSRVVASNRVSFIPPVACPWGYWTRYAPFCLALLRHCFGASPSPCGSAVICFHGPFGSRSPKTNRAPRTRSRSSGDFFWVPPRKLTLALGAAPTRMAAPSVP
jgi:hypothetical protein